MGIFDNLAVGNSLGWYSFLSLIILLILYFLRPKPLKKIIPSLIFLEKSEKKMNMANFFRRFIKDWLLLLQLFLIIMMCLACLDLSTKFMLKKFSREAVFVIDASASSKAKMDGKMLFDIYKEAAGKRIGISNSIVLIKGSPEIVARQANPLSAMSAINSLRPTDSLSNIWDSMMIASDIAGPKADIIVISDFSDTNGKDISTAKQLLEARGFQVELLNPREKKLSNIGIIKYTIDGDKAILNVKNYDDSEKEIKTLPDNKVIRLQPNSVEEFTAGLKEGINEIIIETDDDFATDDKVIIILPKSSSRDALFLTNRKTTYLMSALESIKSLGMKKAEPPIITLGSHRLFVFDNANYASLLPGTIDKIKSLVHGGSNLIIAAQDDIDSEKLGELLPVSLIERHDQEMKIINSATIDKFKDYNFGLSSRYYTAELKDNGSIVIAEANDKNSSPVIVMSKYGLGNVLYYGIFDDYNSFKLSTQYPLFWINMAETLLTKEDSSTLNYKVGNILYGDEIRDPKGAKFSDYVVSETTGIYKIKDRELSVNLLSPDESDLNSGLGSVPIEKGDSYEEQKVMQTVSLTGILLGLVLLLSLLEVFFLKKRGDL